MQKPYKIVINVVSTLDENSDKVKVQIDTDIKGTRAMVAGTINAIMEYFEEYNHDEWIIALTKFLKDRGFDK